MKPVVAGLIYVISMVLVLHSDAAVPSLDRYRVILERKPFGDPPPESIEPSPSTITADESFTRHIRVSAMLEMEDGSVRVGIVDVQNNDNYFLAVGETRNGLELVSADYENEEAVLKKGLEMAVVKLKAGEVQIIQPHEQSARLREARDRRPTTYEERRRARAERMQSDQRDPPQPVYSGEELERHLRDYQMEVIRQGLPPLPIPLTEDMDRQLVEEGVLPPMD